MSAVGSQPKVVIASATFKGTLSSRGAGEAIARGLRSAGLETAVVALADGGEGLVDALTSQVAGALKVGTPCRCPVQTPRTATFGILPKSGARICKTAVIEMAASSGLTLVPENQRDPKMTTTLGVGDQILAAIEHSDDPLEILLGLGGSATNDGGAGMALALGVEFLDKKGEPLPAGGAALINLHRIDTSKMDKRLRGLRVTVACDVRNPLCGPEGASHIFGKQKGATLADAKLLDAALAHYAEIIKRDLKKDVANFPGAGAAGGLGAGCIAFLDAALKPGIELVLDAIGFEHLLVSACLVITGEGMLDRQTLMGKAPMGVAARAKAAGLPCIAIGGSIERNEEANLKQIFSKIESLSDFAGSTEAAMAEPARWLEHLASRKAADWIKGNLQG